MINRVRNIVKIAFSTTLENGTLFAIATTVSQDAIHSKRFLTALSTARIENKALMLPINNFMRKIVRSVLNSLSILHRNQKAH